MENQVEKFSHMWETYKTGVRSRLYTLAESNKLTEATANEVLAEQAQCWQNDYTPEGRWVAELTREDMQRGRQVRKVLAEDQKFNYEEGNSAGSMPTVLGTVGGAVVGLGVASALHMGTVGTIATTAVPAAVGLIGGNIYANKRKDAARKSLVDAYITQLDSFYHSVVALLNA